MDVRSVSSFDTHQSRTFMANITNTILVPKSLEDLQDILQNDTKVKVAGQLQPSIRTTVLLV